MKSGEARFEVRQMMVDSAVREIITEAKTAVKNAKVVPPNTPEEARELADAKLILLAKQQGGQAIIEAAARKAILG